jgi:hypothetical protein
MNHVAEHNVTDVSRGKSRTLQALAYDLGCKLGGGDIFERAPEFSYGGSYSAQYDNFSMSHKAESFRFWN